MLDPRERQRLLKAHVQAVMPGLLETQGSGLESSTGRPLPPRVRDAVRKARDDRELSPEESFALEAIVLKEGRPVVDIQDDSYGALPAAWAHFGKGAAKTNLTRAIPAVGRVDLPKSLIRPYSGTAFVVGKRLLMTNRHVARDFSTGLGLHELAFIPGEAAVIDFVQELVPRDSIRIEVRRVLMVHPHWDMALLEVDGLPAGVEPLRLAVDAPPLDADVGVIGYPAFSPFNDEALQAEIFRKAYNVKRLQPGRLTGFAPFPSFGKLVETIGHDASTLGGNSGSAVVDPRTGWVVGLHFAGLYLKANHAVPAWELARDHRVVDAGVQFERSPPPQDAYADSWAGLESSGPPQAPGGTAPGVTTIAFNLPIQVTVRVGLPQSVVTSAAVGATTLPSATRQGPPREPQSGVGSRTEANPTDALFELLRADAPHLATALRDTTDEVRDAALERFVEGLPRKEGGETRLDVGASAARGEASSEDPEEELCERAILTRLAVARARPRLQQGYRDRELLVNPYPREGGERTVIEVLRWRSGEEAPNPVPDEPEEPGAVAAAGATRNPLLRMSDSLYRGLMADVFNAAPRSVAYFLERGLRGVEMPTSPDQQPYRDRAGRVLAGFRDPLAQPCEFLVAADRWDAALDEVLDVVEFFASRPTAAERAWLTAPIRVCLPDDRAATARIHLPQLAGVNRTEVVLDEVERRLRRLGAMRATQPPPDSTEAAPAFRPHVVNLQGEGHLSDTGAAANSEADVRALFASLAAKDELVVCVHGGLASEASGLSGASSLGAFLTASSAVTPVFLVWETGAFEVLGPSLRRLVFETPVGRKLGLWVLKSLARQLFPGLDELLAQFEGGEARDVPEEGTPQGGPLRPEGGIDEEQLTQWVLAQLPSDPTLVSVLQALATESGALASESTATALPGLDPSFVATVTEGVVTESGGGLLGFALMVARVALAVARRHQAPLAWNGARQTVIEELARVLGGGAFGETVWGTMKRNAERAYLPGRGGALVAELLADWVSAAPDRKLHVAAHSAGSLHAGRLANELAKRLPASTRVIESLTLWAPACDQAFFADTILAHEARIGRIRMFALTEQAEDTDRMVPVVYESSLLCLVSGLLEAQPGWPILGMMRFLQRGQGPSADRARAALDTVTTQAPTAADAGPGRRSAARQHGDFDDDPATRESLVVIMGG